MAEDSQEATTVSVPKWLVITLAALATSAIGASTSVLVDLSHRIAVSENELVHLTSSVEANTAALNTGPRFTRYDFERHQTSEDRKWTEHRQEHRDLRTSIRSLRSDANKAASVIEKRLSMHQGRPAHLQAGVEISANTKGLAEAAELLKAHEKRHRESQ